MGENKTGFFDDVKAYTDAEYDLIKEVSRAHAQGKSPDDIFMQVSDILTARLRTESERSLTDKDRTKVDESQQLLGLDSIKFSTDSYQNYKAMFAQNLLRKKETFGAKQAIQRALRLLEKPRIELRRK